MKNAFSVMSTGKKNCCAKLDKDHHEAGKSVIMIYCILQIDVPQKKHYKKYIFAKIYNAPV